MIIISSFIELETAEGISIHGMMPGIKAAVAQPGISQGFVTVTSQHTTTALAMNENEARLLEDMKRLMTRLIPPHHRYLHNDIELRDCPDDEPENAHSHLAAMLLGSTEVIALTGSELVLGQYQSVLLYDKTILSITARCSRDPYANSDGGAGIGRLQPGSRGCGRDYSLSQPPSGGPIPVGRGGCVRRFRFETFQCLDFGQHRMPLGFEHFIGVVFIRF